MAYTVGIAAALMSFQHIPASAAALQWFNVFMIGFFLYGPQMLIGLCGAELVGPDSVGASEGFLGWIAYLGESSFVSALSALVRGVTVQFSASVSVPDMRLVCVSVAQWGIPHV
jgi:sugar phosphate permease